MDIYQSYKRTLFLRCFKFSFFTSIKSRSPVGVGLPLTYKAGINCISFLPLQC